MKPDAATIAQLKKRFPRAFALHPLTRGVRAILLVAGLATLFALAWHLELVSAKVPQGISKLGGILAAMLPPALGTAGTLKSIGLSVAQTIAMAFLGTLIAAVIAVPLGFLGARLVISNPILHFALRRVFDVFRGIPSLIWALVFVRAVGLGPMTGVLAFIAADFAALSKLNAEAIEAAETGALEAARAAGAGPVPRTP